MTVRHEYGNWVNEERLGSSLDCWLVCLWAMSPESITMWTNRPQKSYWFEVAS